VDINYLRGVQTRCSIVLVSKHWNRVGSKILYEYVVLRNLASVLSYSDALNHHSQLLEAQNTQLTETSTLHVGNYTKFLYICVDPTSDCNLSTEQKHQIAKRFRACRKLEILNTQHHALHPFCASIIDEILAAGCSLRHIKHDIQAIDSTLSIFQHAERLQVLSLSISVYKRDPEPHDWEARPLLSLPRLHTLYLSAYQYFVLEWLAKCEMPELRRVTSTHDALGINRGALESFYKAHGARLTSVDYPGSENCGLDHIIRYCHSLQEIGIGVYDVSRLPHTLPELVKISLYINYEVYEKSETAAMMDQLDARMQFILQHYGASLGEISLVGFEYSCFYNQVWTMPLMTLWKGWISRCAALRIRFKFGSSGDLVHIPWQLAGYFDYCVESDEEDDED
jgi:hypothetical protein